MPNWQLHCSRVTVYRNTQPTVLELFCSYISNRFGFPWSQRIALARNPETPVNLHSWNLLRKYEMSGTPVIVISIFKMYFCFSIPCSEQCWHKCSGCQERSLQWDSRSHMWHVCVIYSHLVSSKARFPKAYCQLARKREPQNTRTLLTTSCLQNWA